MCFGIIPLFSRCLGVLENTNTVEGKLQWFCFGKFMSRVDGGCGGEGAEVGSFWLKMGIGMLKVVLNAKGGLEDAEELTR
ncbi:hypothetical protein [Salinibacillus xinjiangensis]|nr:hypothetical protein [Salinibacillus xinjiangensis]